jgi:2-hydroxy-6-oxonona-2,4-dienedioate hydrolase
VAFIDALELGGVSFVGNSMGGAIGAQVAMDRPELIKRLVTIGGVGVNLFSPTPAEGINLAVEFTENPTRETMVAWLRSMVYDQAMVTDELVDLRMETATEPATLAWARKIFSYEAMARNKAAALDPPAPPAWTQLHRIKAPTLVTWGRDDRVTPLDGALIPLRMIPRCELHVFHDCGHWAMIERKEEFESTVLSFLRRDL